MENAQYKTNFDMQLPKVTIYVSVITNRKA